MRKNSAQKGCRTELARFLLMLRPIGLPLRGSRLPLCEGENGTGKNEPRYRRGWPSVQTQLTRVVGLRPQQCDVTPSKPAVQ